MNKILRIKMETEPMGIARTLNHIIDCVDDHLPKLNVPEKYKPYKGVSMDIRDEGKCCEEIEKYGKHSHPPKEGMKHDDGKLMWDLLPLDAVEQIVEIMTYGAQKYAPNNWQKVKANRYYAALLRHLVAVYKGEDYDKESGYLHLAHAACNVLFLLWKKMNEVE